MNRIIKLLACVGLAFNFPLSTFHLAAQPLPQGYFRNPMDHDIGLSATFAEFRTNHFHGGLDMRTGGATGKPVRAAADGYVAKVSISPWGGGKILYIKHPNGYVTVYMHLDGYAGNIGKAVLKEQYARQSFSINKLFGPDELPVKKGQVVAYSGNTGGSGGPHLHFEVRSGGAADLHTGARLHNPLLFGLPYTDNIKPTIRGIRIYPQDGTPFEVDKSNTARVNGPFHLGIYATDAAEGSTAKNGVDRIEVYLDGKLFFMYTTAGHATDSTRMVNALIDFRHYSETRQAYLLTRSLPGAEGPWIPVRQGDGWFRLQPGSSHKIAVRVYDIKDNMSERTIRVESGKQGTASTDQRHTDKSMSVKYDQAFAVQRPTVGLDLPAYTLYADDDLIVSSSEAMPYNAPLVTVRPATHDIPPHRNFSLRLKAKAPLCPDPSKVVVALVGAKRLTAYRTTHNDDWFIADVRDFGQFTLAVDTVAPTATAVNFSDGAPLKTTTLKVRIGDNLSGIETYHCYLNGNWILAEHDGKTSTLSIDIRGKLRKGSNELVVEAIDGVSNTTRKSWTIIR